MLCMREVPPPLPKLNLEILLVGSLPAPVRQVHLLPSLSKFETACKCTSESKSGTKGCRTVRAGKAGKKLVGVTQGVWKVKGHRLSTKEHFRSGQKKRQKAEILGTVPK